MLDYGLLMLLRAQEIDPEAFDPFTVRINVLDIPSRRKAALKQAIEDYEQECKDAS